MKKDGIVIRRLARGGRVTIPFGLRRFLGIKGGDYVEIFVEAGRIVVRVYAAG